MEVRLLYFVRYIHGYMKSLPDVSSSSGIINSTARVFRLFFHSYDYALIESNYQLLIIAKTDPLE